jgi:replicative DNA helicase
VICSHPVRGGAHPRPMGFSRTGKANGAPGLPGGVDGEQMAQTQTHVPPQNLEAEASVLGAMMVSEGAIAPVILDIRLRDEDFYRERHRIVFRAVKALYERSEPVDALTVTEHLTQQGELAEAGGKDAVSEFASTVPAPGNARHYAQIVKQNSLLRRLLEASQRIQKSVHEREGGPSELVERAESILFKVAHEERASDFRLVAEVLAEEIDRLEALAKGDREVTGTPSGFRDLDNLLGGFQPGNLIVLAARPSLGKSALVCNIAENVATKAELPVAFFSLEMSEAELAHRFIGCRSRIPSDRLRKGKVAAHDWPRVVRACNELEKAPLWLDDSSDLSLLELRAKARRLAANQRGLGLVIVDYMQLMRPEDPRTNRVEQVGQISRGLKILARELNLPVIGVSQLSRAPELRPDKRPILSDLRESGSIEQDADVVAFIYRASKYDEDADPSEADLIVAKHRNGPTGDVPVVFLEQYPRFVDRAGGAERPVEQRAGEGPPLIDLAEEA